jgi:hypothetical protein
MIQYKEGDYFGNVKFIKEVERLINKNGSKKRAGLFECPFCKNKFIKGINEIVTLNTTSCGCKLNKNLKPEYKGSSSTPEYKVWNNLKTRCTNSKAINYHRYGARGIKVCNEWLTSFENFIVDMGKRPSDKHSIDRIDNDGDYYKENCKWATKNEQTRNRCTNRLFEHNGEILTLQDIMNKTGMTYLAVNKRLNKGISIYDILNTKYKRYERIL